MYRVQTTLGGIIKEELETARGALCPFDFEGLVSKLRMQSTTMHFTLNCQKMLKANSRSHWRAVGLVNEFCCRCSKREFRNSSMEVYRKLACTPTGTFDNKQF